MSLLRAGLGLVVALCGAACGTASSVGSVEAAAGAGMPAAGVSASEAGAPSSTPPSAGAPAKVPAATSAGSGGAAGSAGAAGVAAGGAGAAGSATSSVAGGAGAGGAVPQAGSSAAAGANAAGTAPPEPPCPSSSSYAAGNNRKMLEHQGRMRRYNVYVPSALPAGKRVPLVLDFHGNTSNAMQEQGGSGWQQKADAEGFIAVFPDGVGGSWNVGNCCAQALADKVDDVGFAKALVSEVSAAACIDSKRVYATGISNGAGLAHRLACEAADVFAAIAAASADLVTDPCTPARPISELSVRGEADTLVAYAGGNTGSTGWYSPGAKGTLELWRKIDGCTGMPEKRLEYCETYTACSAGVEVTLCSLPRTGHILYDNSLNFDVPKVAWEMFLRQSKP